MLFEVGVFDSLFWNADNDCKKEPQRKQYGVGYSKLRGERGEQNHQTQKARDVTNRLHLSGSLPKSVMDEEAPYMQ